MPNFKKLSVIIVNYQSEQYLQRCLSSLYDRSLEIDFEVVVVNNDEKEKLEKIKEKFSSILLINNEKNIGFGSACNLGVKYSRGDLLFFLNPDTRIKDAFNPICSLWEKDPQIGAVGPRILKANGELQEWSTGTELSLMDLIRNNLGFPRSKKIWESLKSRETSWISGAAMFVPRKTFLEIGGFDEKFFMYFEDNDLCQRIKRMGKKIIYFPEITVVHWGGRSLLNKKDQKKYFYQSQDYYFEKYFGKLQVFLLRFLRNFFK
jgi:N-acetylglucosaminyl-diphospho-decaprenol L-rhamnosyltransferase